ALGVGIVAEAVGEDGEEFLGGAAAGADEVDVAKGVLVFGVLFSHFGFDGIVCGSHAGLFAGRRGVGDAAADAGVAVEGGAYLGVGKLGKDAVGAVEQGVDVAERRAGEDAAGPDGRRAHVEEHVHALPVGELVEA